MDEPKKHTQDVDHPNRCRALSPASRQQCKGLAEEGSEYCKSHQGNTANKKIKAREAYLAEQFTRRIRIDGAEIDEIKLLRENLMVLNSTIAARTKLMTDEASMLAHSGPVTDLVMKAEKVTTSLRKLATSSSFLLAKPALIIWGQKITQAVANMVEDKYDGWEDDLLSLADTISSIIVQAQNIGEDKP